MLRGKNNFSLKVFILPPICRPLDSTGRGDRTTPRPNYTPVFCTIIITESTDGFLRKR